MNRLEEEECLGYHDKLVEHFCGNCEGIDPESCINFSAERIEDWPVEGYAPGSYYCICSNCLGLFQGDKRAVHCLPCVASFLSDDQIDRLIFLVYNDAIYEISNMRPYKAMGSAAKNIAKEAKKQVNKILDVKERKQ